MSLYEFEHFKNKKLETFEAHLKIRVWKQKFGYSFLFLFQRSLQEITLCVKRSILITNSKIGFVQMWIGNSLFCADTKMKSQATSNNNKILKHNGAVEKNCLLIEIYVCMKMCERQRKNEIINWDVRCLVGV